MGRKKNRNNNSETGKKNYATGGEKRDFTYKTLDSIPGVGDDVMSGAIQDGGLVLCGWHESRENWNRPEMGISLCFMLDDGYLMIEAATDLDARMAMMLPADERGRFIRESVCFGVRVLNQHSTDGLIPQLGNEVIDGLWERGVDTVSGNRYALELGPSYSDKNRRFGKTERATTGKHAGKVKMVYKVKALSLDAMVDLVHKLAHNACTAKTVSKVTREEVVSKHFFDLTPGRVLFAGEQTTSMLKNGHQRVTYFFDPIEGNVPQARAQWATEIASRYGRFNDYIVFDLRSMTASVREHIFRDIEPVVADDRGSVNPDGNASEEE